jgi:hypothetical protein
MHGMKPKPYLDVPEVQEEVEPEELTREQELVNAIKVLKQHGLQTLLDWNKQHLGIRNVIPFVQLCDECFQYESVRKEFESGWAAFHEWNRIVVSRKCLACGEPATLSMSYWNEDLPRPRPKATTSDAPVKGHQKKYGLNGLDLTQRQLDRLRSRK